MGRSAKKNINYRPKGDNLTKPALMNKGGKYRGAEVEYTPEEIQEVINWIGWKDPLKTMRRKAEGTWFDGTNETPMLPNWTHLRGRDLWVCHFAQMTMEIGRTLESNKWILYYEGQLQLGEPGSLEEMTKRGTEILLKVWVNKQKQETEQK
jgi:hypothetical protein